MICYRTAIQWIVRLAAVAAVVVAVVAVRECRHFQTVAQKLAARPTPSPTPIPTPTPTPTPTPVPTPTPSPTPLSIPQKRVDSARLFTGAQVRTMIQTQPGATTTLERETPESYILELTLKVNIPQPNRDLAALSSLNEALPRLLPALESQLADAQVSPAFEALYQRKLDIIQRNFGRLDQTLSRHNFFDCETILELQNPQTQRRALLMQADMDVDTDGSDGDRLPVPDGSSPSFQPMTSYRWPKRTKNANPFLSSRESRLRALEKELAQSKGGDAAKIAALKESVQDARYEIGEMKKKSFLLSATDPFVVLPGIVARGAGTPAFTPRLGDYCVVIYGDTIYPAIVGDVGPSDKVGEASLRIARAVNEKASSDTRAESNLKVTYLFFPNTADPAPAPPDLAKWRIKIAELLADLGGFEGRLYEWEELSKPFATPPSVPKPTPKPKPTAKPTPLLTPPSLTLPLLPTPPPLPDWMLYYGVWGE